MTAAPPPPATQRPPQTTRPREDAWQDRLLRSRFFLVALCLHALVFAMIGTAVLVPGLVLAPEQDEVPTFPLEGEQGRDAVTDDNPPQVAPPEANDSAETASQVPFTAPAFESAPPAPGNDLILAEISTGPATPLIVLPGPGQGTGHPNPGGPVNSPAKPNGIWHDVEGLGRAYDNWFPNGRRRAGEKFVAEYKSYLAKYEGGDWAATVSLKNGKIVNGSLINLMVYTTEWTKNRVRGTLVPEPLDLASPKLLEDIPPFILMTGRKDFTLTEAEVLNLRSYLAAGGCVWGDSGLAGEGSRFDVAFKREMKRVLPDIDLKWETLPDDHPLYSSHYELDGPPPGMNHYREPLQAISINGKLAVLYTPNDYADMMRMVYKQGVTPLTMQRPNGKVPRATPNQLTHHPRFFRNFDEESSEACYKLGINITVHLLTRFDDIMKLRGH